MFDDEEVKEEESIPFAMRLEEADEPVLIRPAQLHPQQLQSQGFQPLIRPTFVDDSPPKQSSYRAPPSAPRKGRRLEY